MKPIMTIISTALLTLAASSAWAEEIREVRETNADARIEYQAVTGDLTVIGHDAGEFILEGTLGDDVEELIIEGDAAHWRIELEARDSDGGWGSNGSSDLTLYVPRGADLDIGAVSGDIEASDLSGPALEIGTVSGDIELSAIDSGEIEIETVSGDVTADGAAGDENDYRSVSGDLEIRGAGGRVEVQTVSGDVMIEADALSDFESETVSGSLEARLAPESGASVAVSSHSGSIELHLAVDDTPRIRAETYSGRIESDFGAVEEAGFGSGESLDVDGDSNAAEVEAESFSGRITIRRSN